MQINNNFRPHNNNNNNVVVTFIDCNNTVDARQVNKKLFIKYFCSTI